MSSFWQFFDSQFSGGSGPDHLFDGEAGEWVGGVRVEVSDGEGGEEGQEADDHFLWHHDTQEHTPSVNRYRYRYTETDLKKSPICLI